MSVKEETALQERIQRLIEARGGYVNKNWGNMTSAPGIADLTVCYKGLYIALEVKVGENKPTQAQGIHARCVQRAGGITAVVWSIKEVEKILDIIDYVVHLEFERLDCYIGHIQFNARDYNIDDGTRY